MKTIILILRVVVFTLLMFPTWKSFKRELRSYMERRRSVKLTYWKEC